MWDVVYYLAIVLFLAVATIGGAFVLRTYLGAAPWGSVSGLFRPKPERRLSISEQMNLDNRRRLILIRRDGVEHLIMTGGPVDIVIEQAIAAPRSAEPAEAPAPVHALPARSTLGS